jgi:hypothetical protein
MVILGMGNVPGNAPTALTLNQQLGLVKPNEQERTDRNLDFAYVAAEGCLLIKLVLRPVAPPQSPLGGFWYVACAANVVRLDTGFQKNNMLTGSRQALRCLT